jgi:tetratricopeptide (TPR) repeat protein
MKKKLLATLLGVAGVFILWRAANYFKKKTNDLDAKTFIEKIRDDNKAGFDSLQKAIKYENDLNFRIKKSIDDNEFTTATHLMDSLPAFGKTNSIHLYNGMIYAEQKKYSEALEEYNILIDADPFPLALDKRAKVYIKINKFDFALKDYKKAYSLNYDYSLQIATTFELIQKKDSALNYYKIYLEHYPNDLSVKQKVLLIEKK